MLRFPANKNKLRTSSLRHEHVSTQLCLYTRDSHHNETGKTRSVPHSGAGVPLSATHKTIQGYIIKRKHESFETRNMKQRARGAQRTTTKKSVNNRSCSSCALDSRLLERASRLFSHPQKTKKTKKHAPRVLPLLIALFFYSAKKIIFRNVNKIKPQLSWKGLHCAPRKTTGRRSTARRSGGEGWGGEWGGRGGGYLSCNPCVLNAHCYLLGQRQGDTHDNACHTGTHSSSKLAWPSTSHIPNNP